MIILLALLIAQADGLGLLRKGHYLEARDAIEAAAKQEPKTAATLLALAELRLVEHEGERAEELANQAIRLEPKNSHAYFTLGRAIGDQVDNVSFFSKMGYVKRLKAAFDTAAELDPDSAEAREALCEFYRRAPGIAGGSEEKARSLARELAQIDAVKGNVMLGLIAVGAGEDGTPFFDKASKAARTPEEKLSAQTSFGAALVQAKKFPEAVAKFRAAAGSAPKDARPRAALADALLKSGDADGALAAAREAIALDPAIPPPHFFAGEALLKKNDKPGARAELEAYLKLAPPRARRAEQAREKLNDLR